MPVTKQTYTLNPTWTAVQHADLIRSVFIDAGLMTNWFDSFASGGIENRILEVVYDPSKTYGRTYYWFMFTGGQMAIALATGWNTTSKVPTGSQYLDFFTNTTNATTNHFIVYSWSTTTTLTIFRYQSQINPTFSWFLIRNGTSSSNFHISHSSVGQKILTWINLDRVFFHHFLICSLGTNNRQGYIRFLQYLFLRRSYHPYGLALRGETYNGYYGVGTDGSYRFYPVNSYYGIGNDNANLGSNIIASNNFSIWTTSGIGLPVAFTNVNPAFPSNSNPVFTGAQYSQYLFDSLPDDFGLSMHYANNNIALQDTLVVSSGVEEWEVLNVSNNGTVTTGATPLFLARVI